MDDDNNDASANAMNLNSPEVPDPNCSQFLSEENDDIGRLPSTFTQDGTNSILSKEIKNKNESRRVSFPEDDKIISGYGEPRNPWAHAKTTSTEELIQAYTQSCQHWGVKPITKLLVQLQEIHDFSVRASSLTLKGEKLDTKVVETLEAVFKRVQFVIMDLEATNLDDDSAAALFDMIEYYESAVNVLVGFNRNLGTRGWQAAAHMMRKMSCLRLFDGHSIPLSEQAVPFVGRALRLSHTLVTLHLESASLSGRPMLLIVAALRMNTTLRELFLADNHLVSTDALQIANLIKFNSVLQLLDLRNNIIQDAGLSHICNGLVSQPHALGGGLQTLVLWNNQISHQSMGKLAMALKHTVSLTTLNLGQNVLGDDGASKLKDGLLQNRSLLRLGMVGTKLTCEGAIAVAEFLAESSRLIRLDLRFNDVRVGGLMALSLAFKINFSLLRLDIDKPNPKETLKELVAKQASLMEDILEYSSRNKQKALEKVLNAQLERQKKSDDQKRAGLRYMDMTNSPGASTSQNNSNNNPPPALHGQVRPKGALDGPNDVDDSPMNSPELLPTNSVSYHQVSPVMFSSCEMQKRAELAKHIMQGTPVVSTHTNHTTESAVECQDTSLPENVTTVESKLGRVSLPRHGDVVTSNLSGDVTEIQLDNTTSDDGSSEDVTNTAPTGFTTEDSLVAEASNSHTDAHNTPESSNTDPHACHNTSTLFKIECVDHAVTSCVNIPNDVAENAIQTGDVNENITKISNPPKHVMETGDIATSEVKAQDVTKVIVEHGDVKNMGHDVTSASQQNDENVTVTTDEANVTVTHFDLSMFPKD